MSSPLKIPVHVFGVGCESSKSVPECYGNYARDPVIFQKRQAAGMSNVFGNTFDEGLHLKRFGYKVVA